MESPHYSYQDVFIKPAYSEQHSRDEVSTWTAFGNRKFRLPVVPANMKCVIDEERSKWLSENGYFYIMHRFNKNFEDDPLHDTWEMVKRANEEHWKTISISVGVQDYDKEFLNKCKKAGYRIDFITIDIAHGHSVRMKEMLESLRKWIYPYDGMISHPFIIAGNVATPEATSDLMKWGADAIKVGIAHGSACTTYGKTGFGVPMFSNVLECAKSPGNGCIPVIADGGIRTNGDFAKAIVAGATMVMAGSMFAACKDSPAESVHEQEIYTDYIEGNKNLPVMHSRDGKITHKKYYGSASTFNKHSTHHIEGTMIMLPCNGMTYQQKLEEIEEDFQSSVTYSGNNLRYAKWGVRYSTQS